MPPYVGGFFFQARSAGLSATEAADILVATGLVTSAGTRSATFAATEAADTAALSVSEIPVIWNSADMATIYTLSNGSMTATNTTSGNNPNKFVRAVRGHSTGKRYIEINSSINHANQALGVGLTTSSVNVNSSDHMGFSSSEFAYWGGGDMRTNNSVVATYSAWISGDPGKIAFAVDFDAGKIWFGLADNTPTMIWQGGGNPATGSSPIFTFTAGTQLFPTFEGNNQTDYAILISTSTTFQFPIPSGFSSWAS